MNDDNSPMISVMILCYNYGHLLRKALDACAAQTFRDFEVVMINNGSTDNTEEVYRAFCRENPGIRTSYVPVYPNQGPCHGWNEGLRIAKGEYVLFNDADDWMEPDCLELLAERAKETGADRVTGQCQEVLLDGTVTRVRSIGSRYVYLPFFSLQGVIFKRSVIFDNELFIPEINVKPYDMWFSFNFAIVEKHSGQTVKKTIYNYAYNPISITQTIKIEENCQNICTQLAVITKEAKAKAENEELKTEIEYLALRSVFSSYIEVYSYAEKKDGDVYYSNIRKQLTYELPGYHKNHLLWKINNGYEKPGTIACMVVGLLDLFKAKGLIRLVAKVGRNSGLIRKNVSAEKDGEKSSK